MMLGYLKSIYKFLVGIQILASVSGIQIHRKAGVFGKYLNTF
jgi:hypothetical protein